MMGPYLLFLAAAWLAIVIGLALLVTRKVPDRWWKVPLCAVLVVAILPLPILDDIIGGIQFRQLCRENSIIHVNRAQAAGRTVFRAKPVHRVIKGTWVRVVANEWRFVDATTGETVINYNTFDAGRGFFHPTGAPLTFNGYCAPPGYAGPKALLKKLGVTRVENPVTNVRRRQSERGPGERGREEAL